MNEEAKETNVKDLDCMNKVKHFTQKEIRKMNGLDKAAIIADTIYEFEPFAWNWKFSMGGNNVSRVYGCIGDVNGFFCGNDGKIQHYRGSETKAFNRMICDLLNKKIKFIEFGKEKE